MRSAIFSPLALALCSALIHRAGAATNWTIEAGYHVIHSYPGLTPPSSLLDLTEQGLVGGIILFGENVGSNLASVMESFQTAYTKSPAYSGTPLLIMSDQEGGEVRRLPGGPTLSEKKVGQSSDPSAAATTAGKQAASALKPNGVNSNLAPVLGVFREAGDFLDEYERSYGSTASLVGECAAAFITAQQAAGVIATAKHFPGLGAATSTENTDAEPVTINLTLSQLQSVDEAPYKQAIAAGVDMVMASWAVYPALDHTNPAGLSQAWIQGELRQRLGFKGVTITDAIEAGALEAHGSDGARAVLASGAGMDLILASGRDATQGQGIVTALAKALQAGSLSQSDFDAGTQRILNLRAKL